jgi:hypothetical protein
MRKSLFIIGVFVGALLFVGANIYSYSKVEPPCCDFFAPFGFPLEMGEFGGFAGSTFIDIAGLIGNGLIGICASLVFALLFAKSSPVIFSFLFNSLTRLRTWHIRTRP